MAFISDQQLRQQMSVRTQLGRACTKDNIKSIGPAEPSARMVMMYATSQRVNLATCSMLLIQCLSCLPLLSVHT